MAEPTLSLGFLICHKGTIAVTTSRWRIQQESIVSSKFQARCVGRACSVCVPMPPHNGQRESVFYGPHFTDEKTEAWGEISHLEKSRSL